MRRRREGYVYQDREVRALCQYRYPDQKWPGFLLTGKHQGRHIYRDHELKRPGAQKEPLYDPRPLPASAFTRLY